jgi:DNA recombination protein RmuC
MFEGGKGWGEKGVDVWRRGRYNTRMKIEVVSIIVGLVLGGGLAALIFLLRKKPVSSQDTVEAMKGAFASISQEALSRNSDDFLRLAQQKLSAAAALNEKDLDGKKQLIDQTFGEMKKELGQMETLMKALEKDRENKFAQLAANLDTMTREVGGLQATTEHLRLALAGTKKIGEWGERMAEDVLRMAGFIEGVNYAKQKAQGTGRPDFTFFLPQGLKINMDVKFPWQNYFRYVEASSDIEKESFKSQFIRDVKQRVKEVTTRDYIDPEQKTVDYVLVFIPNEQVYGFIHQNDRTLLDEALRQKVVLCSPLTLYAVLSVIRQAMDNFNLERTAHTILSILGAFEKQYQAFCVSMEKMGNRIDEAKKEFDNLTTTRKNQLDRQLKKIEELRQEKGLALESDAR